MLKLLMVNNFAWASKRAAEHAKIFETGSINIDAFSHVKPYFDMLRGNAEIDLHLVSTARQSSFMLERGQQNAVYLDLSQSFILKNLFNQIRRGNSYIELCESIKSAAALYISVEDDVYAAILSGLPSVSAYSEGYYLVTKETVEGFKESFQPVYALMAGPVFPQMIDWYLLGHEMSHYYLHTNPVGFSGTSSDAESLYEMALASCCYENQDNFDDIANYYGLLNLSEEALATIRGDLANRRVYYAKNKANLVEEIACDFWAFVRIAEFFFHYYPDNVQSFRNFSTIFLLLFSIFDLHFAMIRRSALSLKTGIKSLLPADIADIHLRKMAIIYGMYNYYLSRCRDNGKFLPNELTFEDYNNSISGLKTAIDSLYIAPSTKLFSDLFSRAEDCNRIFQKVLGTARPGAFIPDHHKLFDTELHKAYFK
jgi:hypothetical protein